MTKAKKEPKLLVTRAACCTEHVLLIPEKSYPGDDRTANAAY